jgi:hypothetical protein
MSEIKNGDKPMKYLMIVVFLLSTPVFAADIAFGTLVGIKVYDYPASKVTNLYFADDATHKTVEGCNGVATITHNARSPEALSQIISLAMAAYMAGKKVRANSVNNTCELDFLALQESHF